MCVDAGVCHQVPCHDAAGAFPELHWWRAAVHGSHRWRRRPQSLTSRTGFAMVSARWPKSTRPHDRSVPPRGQEFDTPGFLPVTPALISVLDEETGIPNIMPSVGWGWLNRLPFYLGVAVSVQEITGDYFKRGTHELLRRAGDFALNVPTDRLREAVAACGRLSRAKDAVVDKFTETGLTPLARQAHQVPAHRRVPDQLRVQGARGGQPGIARPVPGRGGRLLHRRRDQARPFVGPGSLPHRAGAGRTAAPRCWSSRAWSTWSASSKPAAKPGSPIRTADGLV